MKKNMIKMMVIALVFCGSPIFASTPEVLNATTGNSNEAKAAVLVKRLEQIKEMDISSMSNPEKKELRKEVKSIKKDLKQMKKASGGVYLSVGAVIIIILILILVL